MAAALTDAEELELEMEQARARKAQADSDAAKSAASGLGITNNVVAPDETPAVAVGKSFIKGVGEEVASLPDLPGKAVTFVRNAPALSTNAGIEAAKTATPEQLKDRGVDPAIVSMQPEKVLQSPDFAVPAYNAAFPPDPNHPTARKIGNITGSVLPAIVAPELLAGRLPGVLPTVLDTAATTGTTYFGGQGGRLVDQSLGGSGDKGEAVGSFLGSLFTPTAANISSGFTTDASSAARAAAAKEAGVDPTLSLVGSNRVAGWGSAEKAAQQQAQMDATAKALAESRRGGKLASGPIASPDIGKDISNAADTGFQSANKDANAIFGPMSEAAGRNTPIDHTIIQAKIDELRNLGVTAKPTLDYYQNLLNSDVSSGGLTWDRALRQRRLTEPSETSLKLDPNIQKQINSAFDDALRKRAGEVGYSPQEFDAVNSQYGGLQGEKDILSKIRSEKGQPAYNEVFSPSNLGGENLSLLTQHNDPSALAKILADNLELKVRGPQVAGRPDLPLDVGINHEAPKWWESMPSDMRDAYFPPGSQERSQMDALMATVRSDARRGGGQAPQPEAINPILAGVLGGPGGFAAAMTPRVSSALVGRVLDNPGFTRSMLERRANPLNITDLARTLAASTAASRR